MKLAGLFSKPIELIRAEDLRTLIGWPESLTVEFKGPLPERDGERWGQSFQLQKYSKEKLFKEVVALANTRGGHLILGINETDSTPPCAASICEIARCADLAEQLQRAAQAIDPPIPLLLVSGVQVTGDAGAVIFRIPQSRLAPHRNIDYQVYVRNGTNSDPVGMRAIRDIVLSSRSSEEITDLRFLQSCRRFERWLDEDCPRQIQAGSAFRISAVPIGAEFDLGRLSRLAELLDWKRTWAIRCGEYGVSYSIPNPPIHRRPILRGMSFGNGSDRRSCVIELHADGHVCILFWSDTQSVERILPLAWIVTAFLNVLRAADRLRSMAGQPECEYSIETQIREINPNFVNRIAIVDDPPLWFGRTGPSSETMPQNDLTLPRLAYGAPGSKVEMLRFLMEDIADLLGVTSPFSEDFTIE